MILYRVEAAFSTVDDFGKREGVNLGPYMAMGTVIETLNDFYSIHDADIWIDEDAVVGDSFYSMSDRHPMPDDKQRELFYESSSFVCGFDSMKKLREWFCNRDLRILKTTNFIIMKYKFDGRFKRSIRTNEFQDVFDLKKCEPVGFIDIEDLLNA
ncbi:unknown function [Cronobacter phage LPCS28]|jgi:hypothetical protein|uniref:Uncharacterized protein n=1 Tax=Cronobacter phage LPCS28 TaxID=2924885 RepID=A0AAE9G4R9_9CAUD|nr:unknown function [Cronobacter phage LPCS28]UNY46990.1 hypothetical protein EHEKIMEA_00108 [Cronobacter phage LPCS28]